jgi:hypothetical protein
MIVAHQEASNLARKWLYRLLAGVIVLSLVLLSRGTSQQAARAQDLTRRAYFPLALRAESVRFDDFQDEDPTWTYYNIKDDPKDGEFFHRDGRLVGMIWDNSAWTVATPGWRPKGDFRLEVDAHFKSSEEIDNWGNTLGLIFGGEIVYDKRNNLTLAEFYEYALAYYKAQHQWTVRRRDADWSVHSLQGFGGVPSFVQWYDRWNHLTVVRKLDKIHVYCNGRRMPSQPSEGFTDGTYGTNRLVGLSIGGWEGNAGEMEFDNFHMTPLSEPY